jgi:DNA-binding beta-propeller fold protein YncE
MAAATHHRSRSILMGLVACALAAGCGGGSSHGNGSDGGDGGGADVGADAAKEAGDGPAADTPAPADAAGGDADAAAGDVAAGDVADGAGGAGGCVTPSAGTAVKVTRPADFVAIFDAVPDATGATIYFTGVDATGRAGVFSVAAGAAPAAAAAVAVGAPFVAPIGIGISSDGSQLYVADPATDEGMDLGGIYAVSKGGGTPSVISKDVEPRGLAVAASGSMDVIVFTGRDPSDGAPGVFRMPASGGMATVVAKGAPFVDPSGVAVAANGDVFVADTIAAPSHHGNLFKVSGGAVSPVAASLTVGYPAGVALACGDAAVWVSLVAGSPGRDAVTSYDPGTMAATGSVTAGLTTLSAPGGLHRAAGVGVFAFVDSAGDGSDAVYVIK